MIISTYIEITFDKIKHPFIIKNNQQNRNGLLFYYLMIVKTIFNKSTINITFIDKKS